MMMDMFRLEIYVSYDWKRLKKIKISPPLSDVFLLFGCPIYLLVSYSTNNELMDMVFWFFCFSADNAIPIPVLIVVLKYISQPCTVNKTQLGLIVLTPTGYSYTCTL